ncbi:MAG: DUF1573 domain-containing protein [Candidatus Omnitrophota bacterium]
MRKIIFLLFMFFCVTATISLAQDITHPSNEKSDKYTWDFGYVKQSQISKHDFILKNDSNKLLVIKSVNTSCGCTASKAKKETLSPGETTDIEVSFNSKGYSGEVKQYIYVHTDNLDNETIRFIIKANVVKE